jgi:tetratricopeptide (TPR) repeat protein
MLLGSRTPHSNNPAVADLPAHGDKGLPRPRSINPKIPQPIDEVVAKCLEIDPAARYQTSTELVGALARLDTQGMRMPVARRISWRLVASTAVLVIALLAGTYFVTRKAIVPEPPHDPLSVLIADLDNRTSDPTFDRALEPTLRRGLEDASFITAYDRSRIGALGVPPVERLGEADARALALKEGVGVVVSGSIAPRGRGYEISVKAAETVTGNEIANTQSRASTKDEVLNVVTQLVATLRRSLGDDTSDSMQLFAMRSVSATSFDVIHHYAAALEAQSHSRYEEARQSYLKTLELDPKFGLGYQGVAVMSRNLGRHQDAENYIKQALQYLDGMTERERFTTRAFYYRMIGDYQQCIDEYAQLTARFAADAIAHNNRVLCLSKMRKMREAVHEMRQAVQILPKRVAFRSNLAVYAAYAGDFETATLEAGAIQESNDLAVLSIAFAQLAQGQIREAAETYRRLATISRRGVSWSATGLADLAFYEGRFTDAAYLFQQGANADLAASNPDKAARKLLALASVQLQRGRTAPALVAAEQALQNSRILEIRFLAARIFVESGETAKAQALSRELAAELSAEPRAYAKIIDGELALKNGDTRDAIKILSDANALLDTWIGHFDLGRAFFDASALPQADGEFERCIMRRGEALSLLVDEEPTYANFPIVYYYQGRVREGLKTVAFTDSYREYLKIRGRSTEDPLVADVHKRLG